MQETFEVVLKIQELDIKMISLMKNKQDHLRELAKVRDLKSDIRNKIQDREKELEQIQEQIRSGENRIQEIIEHIGKLESQQAVVKKMDEFNALTQEMTAINKEKRSLEQGLSDLMDKQATCEDIITSLQESLRSTEANSQTIEQDIADNVRNINAEGKALLSQREQLKQEVDPQLFGIYERLLKNKRSRVVVPIENRVCSGCHIVLTAQHENMVRKKDHLIFCEHCSRILFWQDTVQDPTTNTTSKRRRRKTGL